MKYIFLSLSVLAILATAACKKSDNSATNYGQIMFVNGCAGATGVNINVNVNSTNETAATNMAFLANAGYQSVTAGTSIGMSYILVSTGTTLTSGTGTLTMGNSYSAFAGGSVTAPSFVFTSDDLTPPVSGYAKVRFINLSSDSLNVSCYIGSKALYTGVGYTACTPFAEITDTTANVLLQDPAHPTSLAQLSGQAFAGGIYTVMLTGTGTLAAPLTLTVINN